MGFYYHNFLKDLQKEVKKKKKCGRMVVTSQVGLIPERKRNRKTGSYSLKQQRKGVFFMQTIQMLKTLCQAPGVSGAEEKALEAAEKICKELGECSRTVHKSLVCEVMAPEQGRPHLLLDAHIDEIGLTVTHIEKDGFLRVAQCGGVDRRLVMASPVVVHTENGDFPGVIEGKPEYLQSGEKKNPKLDEIWVDVGMSGEEATEKIALGSKITFVGDFTELENGRVSSKALDDRCCCAAIIKAAEQIKAYWKENHLEPMGLTVLLSSQEETGGLGALRAAFSVCPTHAIVVDVTFGTTPEIADKHCGDLNKGPMVGMGAVLSRRMARDLIAAGKEEQIPHQIEAMGGGGTGTNADGIVKAAQGVETCCVSIPLRYMHTPIETIAVEDVDNTANLIAAYAKKIGR